MRHTIQKNVQVNEYFLVNDGGSLTEAQGKIEYENTRSKKNVKQNWQMRALKKVDSLLLVVVVMVFVMCVCVYIYICYDGTVDETTANAANNIQIRMN